MIDELFLSKVPIFSSLTVAELVDFTENWNEVSVKDKQTIFLRGDAPRSIYVVVEGSVDISIRTFDNKDLVLSVLGAGEIFGELTLFDDVPRTATATAQGPVKLLEMPRDRFIEYLKKHSEIGIAMLGMLGKRLRETNQLMEHQATRNVNQEVDKALTFGERLSDKVSDFIGSWKFIIIFIFMLFAWVILNTYAILFPPADPYPFTLLNVILSCIAALQAPVIMMSQGRQALKDRIAADLDYKINLKAELQVEEIHEKIDQINAQEMEELRELKKVQAEILSKLNKS